MNTLRKTKYRTVLSSRGRERLNRAKRRFDIATAILALLIVAAMVISAPYPYELGTNRPEGFATWFLLFLAYLPLEIVGLVTWIFGLQDSLLVRFLVEERQTLALGIFNLTMLAAIWGSIRFYFSRRYGINLVQTTTTFLLILAGWGAFQIGCIAAVVIWDRGGFSPLHSHLRRAAEPERVIVVGSEDDGDSIPDSTPMRKNP